MKRTVYLSLGLFFAIASSCNSQNNSDITIPELNAHLKVLAGENLQGRAPGSPQDSLLLTYISSEFKSIGLEFFEGNGIPEF
jgi:hypothetical protein